MNPSARDIPYIIAPSAGGTSDLIAPEFPEGIALRYSGLDQWKQLFSAIGMDDSRLSNEPQALLSGVPTELTMGKFRAYKIGHPRCGLF